MAFADQSPGYQDPEVDDDGSHIPVLPQPNEHIYRAYIRQMFEDLRRKMGFPIKLPDRT